MPMPRHTAEDMMNIIEGLSIEQQTIIMLFICDLKPMMVTDPIFRDWAKRNSSVMFRRYYDDDRRAAEHNAKHAKLVQEANERMAARKAEWPAQDEAVHKRAYANAKRRWKKHNKGPWVTPRTIVSVAPDAAERVLRNVKRRMKRGKSK